MTENKKPICAECGAPVEPTAARKHFDQYQGVYCPECRDAIDKAIGDGLIAGDEADEPEHTPEPVNQVQPAIQETIAILPRPSNRIKGITPQLCECGAIRIGMKGVLTTSRQGTKFRPPIKLNHFIVTTPEKTEAGDFVLDSTIMNTMGENCTSINVTVLFNDTDLIFPTSYAMYDSAVCQCRGDGEVAVKHDGTTIECNTENCKHFLSKKCKANGILSVILEDSPKVGGVHKFRTTSWNSIRNITSALDFIKSLTGGYLAGLPLVMTLQPKTTVIPGTKKTTTIYMVNIEYRGTLEEMRAHTIRIAGQQSHMKDELARMEVAARTQILLPESVDECKDVQEEFYSEMVA